MILLAFFAVRFTDTDTVPRPEHEALRQRYKTLEAERDGLVAELTRLRQEVLSLHSHIAALNERNVRLQDQIREKDVRIAALLAEIRELRRQLEEQNPLEQYIITAQARRAEILQQIEKALKIEFRDNILVEISPENDALRFTGEGLFASGSRTLLPEKKAVIHRLGELITEAIACFTVNQRQVNYAACNPHGIVIEAVQIEGHTDSIGTNEFNIGLSTDRANNAFLTMLAGQPDLLSFHNMRGQPVISVAGYGEMRPIASNILAAGRAENRRIDLRLIMYTPRDREQVEQIQQQIRDGLRLVVEKVRAGP
ncbi:MAG: OmpA family protein [Alphaproteobacteria bacterium]|nr:OmpA family protein [Alphaproteobacteria bacterium]